MPHVDYTPTDEERGQASAWRAERTLGTAWRAYRAFCQDPRWATDSELPVFDEDDNAHEEYEQRVTLHMRADARVVLVCEKGHILDAIDTWRNSERPSVAHAWKASLAWAPSLPSRWTSRILASHAKDVGAPLAYFGDLDPQALHAFAVLRAGSHRALLSGKPKGPTVTWIGLDSGWLEVVCRHFRTDEIPVQMKIRLDWLDQEYWELVKRLVPDVRKLIGARGFALLESGVKLEADALLHMREAFLDEFGRRVGRLVRKRGHPHS